MTLPAPPPTLLNQPRGTMLLVPASDHVNIFVREERLSLCNYPNPCGVDVRLPHWESDDGTVTIAFLLSLARKPRLTLQRWINTMSMPDLQLLTGLSRATHLNVNIVVDRVERAIRAPNLVRRNAIQIHEQITRTGARWSTNAFEAARDRLDSLYVSPTDMWRACGRDAR